jgi:hypothetical protein
MELYGSLTNRLEENRMLVKEIKVGTRLTEYFYTDTHAYEVIKVINQNDVIVKALEGPCNGDVVYDKDKEYHDIYSIEEKAGEQELVKRYGHWYFKIALDKNDILVNEKEAKQVKEKGFAVRYNKVNVSFGVAEIYFDRSF